MSAPPGGGARKVRRVHSADELADALALRHRVFVEEQGVGPALELDGRDPEALHVVALEDGVVVGTCRVLFEGGLARLGRLAVEPGRRGAGIGAAVLRAAEREVRQTPARRVQLHAQVGARSLYAAAGYEERGDPFMEAGIEHVTMEKRLA